VRKRKESETMKRLILLVLVLGIAAMNMGCASVLAYRHTQDRALRARVAAGEVGVGVDVTALGGKVDWPLQIGAAVVDVGVGLAAYKLYQEIQEDADDDDDKPVQQANDNVAISAGGSVYYYDVDAGGHAAGDGSVTDNRR
jgi:hypothetical protein